MELFKKCKLLKLRDIVELELGKFGYKLVNDIILKPLCKLADSIGGKKTHRYPTRNKNLPNIQKHSLTIFNQSYVDKPNMI